ncbi:MAG: T9SS type A sorting domain-containing protein [Bacteroidetes bacterium]|nr:T9SS type A sorting domain-containing protein [Bacteroidota bacterium]
MKHVLVACIVCAISVASVANAQWERIGPTGGVVTSFATKGSLTFAGTIGAGVITSADSGKTWRESRIDDSVMAVAVIGNHIFAGTAGNGIFRSDDDGTHWAKLAGTEAIPGITALAVIDTELYATTNGLGVKRSANLGESWSAITNGLNGDWWIGSLAVVGTDLFACSGRGYVYRRSSVTTPWVTIDSNRFNVSAVGGSLYTCTFGNTDVRRSTDHGASWTVVDSGIVGGCSVVTKVCATENVVLALGNQSGVFRTVDNGSHWTVTSLYSMIAATAIGDVTLVGDYQGIHRSTDLGASWELSNNGIYMFEQAPPPMAHLLSIGNRLLAGVYAQGSVSMFRSDDSGYHWVGSGNGLASNTTIHDLLNLNGSVYAAADSKGVFRSDDDGLTWNPTSQAPNQTGMVYSLTPQGSNVLCGTVYTGGIWMSSDKGVNWAERDNGFSYMLGTSLYSDAQLLCSNGDALIAATGYGGIFASSDLGNSWHRTAPNLMASALYAWGKDFYAASTDTMTANVTVSVSHDSGVTWQLLPATGLTMIFGSIRAFVTEKNRMLAGGSGGVFVSLDSGASWSQFNEGLEDRNVFNFALYDGYVYASTSYGLWRRKISDLPVGNAGIASGVVANSLGLNIYPNPASDRCVVSFDLPTPSNVTIDVVNMYGLVVATLTDEILAAGRHTIDWNASAAATGEYVIRLRVGGSTATATIVLIRE